MKKLLLIMLAGSALACGDSGASDHEEVGAMDPAEFGSLEQALYVPDGYGVDMSQNRCGNPFAGGRCLMPDRRDWVFQYPAATGAGQRACTDTDFRAALETAAREAHFYASSVGWPTSVSQATASSVPVNTVYFSCDNGPTSGTVGAKVTVPSTCLQSQSDCHTTSRGEILQYGTASVTIYPNRIKNLPSITGGYSSLTQTQKRNLITNIVLHEYFHVLGLGHASESTSPLMGFGSSGAMPGINGIKAPTSTELGWIDCYNESSGTTPRC